MAKFKVMFMCRATVDVLLTGSIIAEDKDNAYDLMSSNADDLFRLDSIDIDKRDIVQRVRETSFSTEFMSNDRSENRIEEIEDRVKINFK